MVFEMSKVLIGFFAIILVASLLSGGLYLLVQNGVVGNQLLGQISNVSGLGVSGGESGNRYGSGEAGLQAGVTSGADRQPLGDPKSDYGSRTRFVDGLNDIAHNLFLIAGITMAVILVEKVFSVFCSRGHSIRS
jgi:hypothetical protein